MRLSWGDDPLDELLLLARELSRLFLRHDARLLSPDPGSIENRKKGNGSLKR